MYFTLLFFPRWPPLYLRHLLILYLELSRSLFSSSLCCSSPSPSRSPTFSPRCRPLLSLALHLRAAPSRLPLLLDSLRQPVSARTRMEKAASSPCMPDTATAATQARRNSAATCCCCFSAAMAAASRILWGIELLAAAACQRHVPSCAILRPPGIWLGHAAAAARGGARSYAWPAELCRGIPCGVVWQFMIPLPICASIRRFVLSIDYLCFNLVISALIWRPLCSICAFIW